MFTFIEAKVEDLHVGDTLLASTGHTGKVTTWERHDDEVDPITGEPIPVHYHMIVTDNVDGVEFEGVLGVGEAVVTLIGFTDDEATSNQQISEAARNYLMANEDPFTAALRRLGLI